MNKQGMMKWSKGHNKWSICKGLSTITDQCWRFHFGLLKLRMCVRKDKENKLTLKLPGPAAGMGGSLTVTVA